MITWWEEQKSCHDWRELKIEKSIMQGRFYKNRRKSVFWVEIGILIKKVIFKLVGRMGSISKLYKGRKGGNGLIFIGNEKSEKWMEMIWNWHVFEFQNLIVNGQTRNSMLSWLWQVKTRLTCEKIWKSCNLILLLEECICDGGILFAPFKSMAINKM